MDESVRMAAILFTSLVALLSGLSTLFHHLTLVGASGVGEDGRAREADTSSLPELKPVRRNRLISVAVFAVSATAAWLLLYERQLVDRWLHAIF